MERTNLTVLHILWEYKFYSVISENFNNCEYYHNIYSYQETRFNGEECRKFEKASDKILIFKSFREILNIISKEKIDIIYFHSLTIPYWYWVARLPKNLTVIWWVWGYDVYNNAYGFIRPLIDMELYKPITKRYRRLESTNLVIRLRRYIKSLFFLFFQKKAMNNISYLQTVTDVEFNMLSTNTLLSHVKHFYAPFSTKFDCFYRNDNAKLILVGNSASDTNNHADILQALNMTGIKGKEVLLPMSYGSESYSSFLKEYINSNSYHFKIRILDTFLPINEYEELFTQVSHAIFGVLRQQAMGNIKFCLRHGVKVFLYKESILYKELKGLGFLIFSIDGDLTKEQLDCPLSEEEAMYNYNKWSAYIKDNNIKAKQTAENMLRQKLTE